MKLHNVIVVCMSMSDIFYKQLPLSSVQLLEFFIMCLLLQKEMNINVHTTKPESEPMVVDVPGPDSLEANMQSSAPLPSLEPIGKWFYF